MCPRHNNKGLKPLVSQHLSFSVREYQRTKWFREDGLARIVSRVLKPARAGDPWSQVFSMGLRAPSERGQFGLNRPNGIPDHPAKDKKADPPDQVYKGTIGLVSHDRTVVGQQE